MTVPSQAEGYAGPPLTTDPITLRILRATFSPDRQDSWNEIIKTFTDAHPNITIKEEIVPWSEISQKVTALVAGGDPPDIFFIDGPFVKSYAFQGIILPIGEYFTQAYIDDFVPATLAEHSFQGEIYAPPENQSSLALFYNKKMTDAAGIQPPTELDQGWTFDQALDAWQKLQQDPSGQGNVEVWGLAPSIFGAGGPGYYYKDGIFIRSMGDPNADKESSAYKTFNAVSEDGLSVKGYIDTPEARQGMEWFQKLTMEWQVTPKVGIPGAFTDGRAAMDIADDFMIGDIKYAHPEGDFEFGVTAIPKFNTRVTMTGSSTFAVSSKTQHPAEAAALLVWTHTTENSYKLWETQGTMPAQLSVFKLIPQYSEMPLKMFFEELTTIGVPRPNSPGWLEYETIINPALRDIALGADVAATLKAVEADIDAQLAKYR
jgi:ABC-type glycerol-3-phosphate transport system substrate-binding protein